MEIHSRCGIKGGGIVRLLRANVYQSLWNHSADDHYDLPSYTASILFKGETMGVSPLSPLVYTCGRLLYKLNTLKGYGPKTMSSVQEYPICDVAAALLVTVIVRHMPTYTCIYILYSIRNVPSSVLMEYLEISGKLVRCV